MVKVLFVCLGNICRSPLAEGLFINKLESKGLLTQFRVDSCGTGDYHIGERPDPRTVENAESNGIHLPSLARQVTESDLVDFDYILAMDATNAVNVSSLTTLPALQRKVQLMRDYDPLKPGADVPDPYFGGSDGFQKVFKILDRATTQLLSDLLRRHYPESAE